MAVNLRRSLAHRRGVIEELMGKRWLPKVGFEFHVQIKTKRKMFSSSLASSLERPNTMANLVDLALPGMLPVLNEECLHQAIKCSLALQGDIPPFIKFDRKHYAYADLPQAYQITQKHHPVMQNGHIRYFDYLDQPNIMPITVVQMEQDTAKSIY